MKNKFEIRTLLAVVLLIFCSTSLMGCFNIFDPVDNPSGDDQKLATARACLDEGDFECAAKYYGELSNDKGDIAYSESAFSLLEQNGLGLSGILTAFGSGGTSGGDIINVLVDYITKEGLTPDRDQLFDAFKSVRNINNGPLRGLVRLMTSLVLLAELFYETKGDKLQEKYLKTDLISNAGTCVLIASEALCLLTANCSSKVAAGTAIDMGAITKLEGPVNLNMIHATILEANKALGITELGASGKFSSGAAGFMSTLAGGNYTPNVSPGCYGYLLIKNGVGK